MGKLHQKQRWSYSFTIIAGKNSEARFNAFAPTGRVFKIGIKNDSVLTYNRKKILGDESPNFLKTTERRIRKSSLAISMTCLI